MRAQFSKICLLGGSRNYWLHKN